MGFFAQVSSPEFPVDEIREAKPSTPLGCIVMVGRRFFVLSKAGSVALTRGLVVTQPAVVANHLDCTVVTGALNAKQLTVTLGATLASEDQYARGTAIVRSDGPSGTLGQHLDIASHLAAASEGNLTLNLENPITVALDTSTKVDLVANRFNGTLVMPTSQAGVPSGVPIVAVTAAYYYWGLFGGQGPGIADEALTRGQAVTMGTGVAGRVEVLDAAGEVALGVVFSNAIADGDAGEICYMMPL